MLTSLHYLHLLTQQHRSYFSLRPDFWLVIFLVFIPHFRSSAMLSKTHITVPGDNPMNLFAKPDGS